MHKRDDRYKDSSLRIFSLHNIIIGNKKTDLRSRIVPTFEASLISPIIQQTISRLVHQSLRYQSFPLMRC